MVFDFYCEVPEDEYPDDLYEEYGVDVGEPGAGCCVDSEVDVDGCVSDVFKGEESAEVGVPDREEAEGDDAAAEEEEACSFESSESLDAFEPECCQADDVGEHEGEY